MKVSIGGKCDVPEVLRNRKNLSKMSRRIQTIVGEKNEYLSSYFSHKDISEMDYGDSVLITTQVGSGKTIAIIDAITNVPIDNKVYYFTNRRSSVIQIKKDILKKMGENAKDWSEDAILRANTGHIQVKTYQSIASIDSRYIFEKNSIIILDEVQYLLNDSTFSYQPEIFIDKLKQAIETTKRIYVSATIDEVVPVIYDIEKKNDTVFNTELSIWDIETHIIKIYAMASDWSHLNIKCYNYDNQEMLTQKLNEDSFNGKKSIVFVSSKERGLKYKELLENGDMVYASSPDRETLEDIEVNERFKQDSLISTKVLENGVSIVDDSIENIIIEEFDPVTFVQMLGRVRVNRKKPRNITVWVPNYTKADLNQFCNQLHVKLTTIKKVINNTEYCMRNYNNYTPFVYYSINGPRANILAYQKFSNLYIYLSKLIEDDNSHAFLHSIIQLLELPNEIQDKQFLEYDDIATFKSGVSQAYNEFEKSSKLKANRDNLAKELIKIATQTNVYTKKITGSQIQLDRINEILKLAGINNQLQSLGETFSVSEA